MSDLISRKETYNELIESIDWLRERDYELYCVIGDSIRVCLDEQPTAYDVDKVVEELPDDVCEWELKNACYTTSIKHYYSLPTSIVKTFNNCPYCGKKIKVVE